MRESIFEIVFLVLVAPCLKNALFIFTRFKVFYHQTKNRILKKKKTT